MFACFQVLNLIRLNFKSSFKSLTFSRFYLQTSTQRKDKAEVQKRRFLHTVSSRQSLWRRGGVEESTGTWSHTRASWPVTAPLRSDEVSHRRESLPSSAQKSAELCGLFSTGAEARGSYLWNKTASARIFWATDAGQCEESHVCRWSKRWRPLPPPLTFSNPFFLSFIQNTMSLRKGVKESWWGQEDQTAGLETPHHRYFFTCVVFACRLYKCVSYLLLLLKETCGFNGFVMMIKSVSAECPERGQNQINLHFHSIFTKLIIVIHRGQLWREEAL